MAKKRKREEATQFSESSYKTPKQLVRSNSYSSTESREDNYSEESIQTGSKRAYSNSISPQPTKKQKREAEVSQNKFNLFIEEAGRKQDYFNTQKNHRIKSLERVLDKVSKVKSQVTADARIEQLETHAYKVINVEGDGNCLFRAVAHSLYGNDENYREIRNDAVAYMTANPESFTAFMEDDQNFEDYLRHMSSDGAWGGNQEIVAIANTYNLQIVVFAIGSIQVINPDNYIGDREMQTIGLLHHINHFWVVRDTQDEFRIPTIEELPPLTAAGEQVTSSDSSSAGTTDLTGDEEVSTQVLSERELRTISDCVSEALDQAGYKVEKVPGDGNCLFRAFAKALAAANQIREKDVPDHTILRHWATQRLQNDNENLYKKFLNDDQSLKQAIVKLSTLGDYAGTLAFQLLADIFAVNIYVVGGTSNTIISNTEPNTAINLIIFYNGVDHFDAVIPKDYDELFIIFQEETSNPGTPIDQASVIKASNESDDNPASVTQASNESDDNPASDIWRLYKDYQEENTALRNQVDNYDNFFDVGLGVSTVILMLGIALSYTPDI